MRLSNIDKRCNCPSIYLVHSLLLHPRISITSMILLDQLSFLEQMRIEQERENLQDCLYRISYRGLIFRSILQLIDLIYLIFLLLHRHVSLLQIQEAPCFVLDLIVDLRHFWQKSLHQLCECLVIFRSIFFATKPPGRKILLFSQLQRHINFERYLNHYPHYL